MNTLISLGMLLAMLSHEPMLASRDGQEVCPVGIGMALIGAPRCCTLEAQRRSLAQRSTRGVLPPEPSSHLAGCPVEGDGLRLRRVVEPVHDIRGLLHRCGRAQLGEHLAL
jgi:hypothetical protein